MQEIFNNWLGWLGFGVTGFTIFGISLAGLSWIPGVGLALRVFVAALEAASPIINGVFSAIIWVWAKILFPGILNIFSNWSSIFTVIIMGSFLWFGLASRYEIRHIKDQRVINSCSTKPEVQEPEEEINLPWPFKWK